MHPKRPTVARTFVASGLLLGLFACGSESGDSPDAAAESDGAATADGDVPDAGWDGKKRIFITSTLVQGDFGGLDQADALCATAASAGGLAGTFVALLSDDQTSALNRFSENGPWYSMNDTVIFEEKPQGPQFAPLSADYIYNEHGNAGVAPEYWTGGSPGLDENCSNWTSTSGLGTVGSPVSSINNWLASADAVCGASEPVLCIQP